MSSSIDKLALRIVDMHKQNINPPDASPKIAEVIGINPLKIQWGVGIILTEQKLHIPKKFNSGIPYKTINRYQDTNGVFNDIEIDQVFKIDLSVGDNVIIIPDSNYKMFYVIDLL
jgi:hypothetical protein